MNFCTVCYIVSDKIAPAGFLDNGESLCGTHLKERYAPVVEAPPEVVEEKVGGVEFVTLDNPKRRRRSRAKNPDPVGSDSNDVDRDDDGGVSGTGEGHHLSRSGAERDDPIR